MNSYATEFPSIRNQKEKSYLDFGKKQKKKAKIGSYIEDSLKRIEQGCYDNGKLCVDGGYGDFRMSVFRLRDKKRRLNELPTIFTPEFVGKINDMNPNSAKQLNRLVSIPNDVYLKEKELEQSPNVEERKRRVSKLHWKEEEQGQLIYQYVPKYQRQKWFSKTIDHCEPSREKPTPKQTLSPVLIKSRKRVKPTHIFRFLDLSANRSELIN